ncbi:helix-turn-helix domain-containing protein [Azospirillum largimobile]
MTVRAALDPASMPPIIGVERSITVAEAAHTMGADESTVRKLVRQKELQGYRLGKRGVRVYVSSIRDYQERQRLQGPGVATKAAPAHRRAPTPAHREAVAQLAALGIMVTPAKP